MKILLDTHIWLWYSLGNAKLTPKLKTAITDPNNELWLSPISVWETLLLAEKGRILLPPDPITWVNTVLTSFETREAVLNHKIAILSRQLACPHQDPADRFIAATAVYYNLQLATMDHSLIATPSLQTIN
jgi:PIN domain nuclease of toxin-antitoxin system